MIVHSTEELNPISPRDFLENMIGRLILDTALGASKIRQRSMILSVADNRASLARRRDTLEETTASQIEVLFNLAEDHGLNPLRGLTLTEMNIVELAMAPLNRERNRPTNTRRPEPPAGRDPLDTFTDERLVDALYELSEAIRTWEWVAATESPNECSPEEAGALVLDRLAKATAAARREEALS